MPKKPLSGYFRFAAKLRSESKSTVSPKEVTAKWNELSEEEKEVYNKKYYAEMEAYEEALNEYYEKKEEEESQKKAEKKEEKRRKRLPIKQQREATMKLQWKNQ